jgi:hypothetical protein
MFLTWSITLREGQTQSSVYSQCQKQNCHTTHENCKIPIPFRFRFSIPQHTSAQAHVTRQGHSGGQRPAAGISVTVHKVIVIIGTCSSVRLLHMKRPEQTGSSTKAVTERFEARRRWAWPWRRGSTRSTATLQHRSRFGSPDQLRTRIILSSCSS